jgi:glutamate-1-semialdehyde 2,1-aminomutase
MGAGLSVLLWIKQHRLAFKPGSDSLSRFCLPAGMPFGRNEWLSHNQGIAGMVCLHGLAAWSGGKIVMDYGRIGRPPILNRYRYFLASFLNAMTQHKSISRQLQQRAEHFLPGGVDSPVRAFRAVGGEPPFLKCAQGAYVWDADGNRYLDYVGSWGPMILGHAQPAVVEAIQAAAANSASFGASIAAEADLAEIVAGAVPSIEKIRFVSSGTEATMSAIRLARAFTGRKFTIKFEGCYHGHADGLLVKAGSGVATFGIPGSAGVPDEIARLTIALPFNDIAAVEAAFAAHPNEIACVIVEPIVGNMGCVLPAVGYLESLRSLTKKNGALLIFDEVMTGFRVSFGGAQELFGIVPDLTCLGKVIGGGLPCGAFGGRTEIMDLLAPCGPVYQAGTLSGNHLAMAAGIATLRHLAAHRQEIYSALESCSAALVDGLAAVARDAGVAITANRAGSMFTWFFTASPVTNYSSALASDTVAFARFHRAMLERGIWLPPSQFEAAFLSLAHTVEDVAVTVEAARNAFAPEAAEK